jgi:hypothetical protein
LAGIAELYDVSLLVRLRDTRAFLGDILARLLADLRGEASSEAPMTFALVDGSTVSYPGSNGGDWRLHARYEPARRGFTDLAITQADTAEAVECVALGPGDVLVQDCGYARVRNFAHVRTQGADVITRIGWRSLRLSNATGESFDLLAAWPEGGEPIVEYPVQIDNKSTAVPARLIIARKPPEATERQHRRSCAAKPVARAPPPIRAPCAAPAS